MKAQNSLLTLVVIPLIFLAASCEPLEKYSDIPEVQFKRFDRYRIYSIETGDTSIYDAGDLVFTFIDGDSNFGVDLSTRPKDSINLVLVPFQKVNGVYDSISTDLYGQKFIVKKDPRMEGSSQNQAVKGEIKVQIIYFVPPPFDTIRYDFYIVDRAKNKSNVDSTSDISF